MKCKCCGNEMTEKEQAYGNYCSKCWNNQKYCKSCGKMLTPTEKAYADGHAQFCSKCWNEIIKKK